MTAARPVEIELKYRVDDVRAAGRLLDAETIGAFDAAGPARIYQIEDRYIDTADRLLARAGFAARLRHGPSGTSVSIKSVAAARRAALHRREELEGPADDAFAPHDWPASAARSLVLELAGDAPLVELVTVRQLRRVRLFRSPDAAVEISLDEVDVVSRGRIVEHATELEVELREGPVERLEALALEVERSTALTASDRSKLEIALAAAGIAAAGDAASDGPHDDPASDDDAASHADPSADAVGHPADAVGHPADAAGHPADAAGHPADAADHPADAADPPPDDGASGSEPEAATVEALAEPKDDRSEETEGPAKLVVGRTPGVRADDTLAEAGRKVLRFHLARMLAKEPGTRAGKDSEELHAMRVATRRMRAAWRVFGEAYRPRRERRYVRDLREVAARLGAVRDLDVLIDDLRAYARRQPDTERANVEPLVDAWRLQRDDARDLLLRTLDGDAYRRFVDEYREFVRTEGLGVLPVVPTSPHRVRDRMPTQIWAAYDQVRAYEPILRWADVETLHELRIAAKRLRYTIEFIREPIGPEAAPLIERIVALQDHLGLLHDADVAAGLARQFLVERSAGLSEAETAAVGRFLVDRERELARLRRTVGASWRRVAGLAFRRALGRAVAGL